MARFHRETKKKKQFEVCVTDKHRQTESIVDNNRLLARRGDQQCSCAYRPLYRMSFQDFAKNFSKLEICNLGPDSAADDSSKKRFQMTAHEGCWKKRVNAGGCRNYISQYSFVGYSKIWQCYCGSVGNKNAVFWYRMRVVCFTLGVRFPNYSGGNQRHF